MDLKEHYGSPYLEHSNYPGAEFPHQCAEGYGYGGYGDACGHQHDPSQMYQFSNCGTLANAPNANKGMTPAGVPGFQAPYSMPHEDGQVHPKACPNPRCQCAGGCQCGPVCQCGMKQEDSTESAESKNMPMQEVAAVAAEESAQGPNYMMYVLLALVVAAILYWYFSGKEKAEIMAVAEPLGEALASIATPFES